MAAGGEIGLGHAVAWLGAATVAVPLFRRLGLGSVLGYLAAGVLIGPFGFALFADPEAILHVAELGVVMFLFLIGLEMRPSKLWALRRDIFGLGLAQVVACGAILTGAAMAFGLAPAPAFIGAMGFVLSSTAVIMTMLEERDENATPSGGRAVSILLFEDLSIVPLLAVVALLAASGGMADPDARPAWLALAIAVGAVAFVVAAGRYALNPILAFLARFGGREIMTAAALLVVLGSAFLMQEAGLSMAMGAFLAGVLLSESRFRHQLEADVEPFRGILLGMFFVSVGMSLDLALVAQDWRLIGAGVLVFMALKAAGIYGVARAFRQDHREALARAALFAQGGEFAFVLYAAARTGGVIDARAGAAFSAVVIISMALTPLIVLALDRWGPRPVKDCEGVEKAEDLSGRVLIVGFGRFAQVVSQPLLARGVDVSLIETDVEMIRVAGNFGFKVYYGDGSRLDVLRASGAERAEAILVCIDKPEVADKIVELVQSEFPHAKLYVRAYDRGHSMRLIQAGVELQVRETFESAIVFGEQVLRGLGFSAEVAEETMRDVRRRDEERLELQVLGGLEAGRSLLRGNMHTPEPAPLVRPRREGVGLNEEAAELIEDA